MVGASSLDGEPLSKDEAMLVLSQGTSTGIYLYTPLGGGEIAFTRLPDGRPVMLHSIGVGAGVSVDRSDLGSLFEFLFGN